jgi:hypothetical protein
MDHGRTFGMDAERPGARQSSYKPSQVWERRKAGDAPGWRLLRRRRKLDKVPGDRGSIAGGLLARLIFGTWLDTTALADVQYTHIGEASIMPNAKESLEEDLPISATRPGCLSSPLGSAK